MKPIHHVARAALPAALFAAAAVAQAQTTQAQTPPPTSSVTIFGVADAALRQASTNKVGTVRSLASGSYSSARWGLRGVEDLGGGQSVSFWLESFLNLDTGAQTPSGFQRRSTVSFVDQKYGEIRLGRDYTPSHTYWAGFDPFNYVGIGSVQLLILSATGNTPATAAFAANPNDIQRANNGIQYILPKNAYGVEGAFYHTFKEGGLAANDQHQANGGRLGWGYGPFFIGGSTFTTYDSSTVTAFKDQALSARYTFPWAKFTAGVRKLTYQNAGQHNYLFSGSFPFGVQELKFSLNRAVMGGSVGRTSIENDRTNQYAVGYVYNFSKRTRMYATGAMIKNTGNARFVIPGAPGAPIGGLTSRGFEAGMNHEF